MDIHTFCLFYNLHYYGVSVTVMFHIMSLYLILQPSKYI